jgi:ElaB/YqjD/DUF883 family membrane-anchored ribosome-binding protein
MKSYSYENPTDWFVDTARRKPEAFLLLAAGCALLMRTGRGSQTSRPEQMGSSRSSMAEELRGNAQEARGQVSQALGQASETVSGYVGDMKDRLSDYAATAGQYADRTRERLSAGSDQMSKHAQSAVQNASETIREQPLLVAALGLVTGAAVASFFPPTEVERRTFGTAGRTMVEAANRGREKLVQAAGEAAQQLKDDAAARGMTPDGVKQMARAATDTFSKTVAGTREQNTGAASEDRENRE